MASRTKKKLVVGMGFPACSAEAVPRALLRIALLLGHLRRLISLAFRAVSLADLLDADDSWRDGHVVVYGCGCARQRSDAGEALLVVRRDELEGAEGHDAGGGCCAVCLFELERREEEIRRLPNCRHVFHRGCLDLWLEHDRRRTCPLCRAPLVAGGERPLSADDSPWLDSECDELAS